MDESMSRMNPLTSALTRNVLESGEWSVLDLGGHLRIQEFVPRLVILFDEV
jgi:hypothetical protein